MSSPFGREVLLGRADVGPDPLAKLGAGVTLLAFGASWCAPWPQLQAILEQLRQDGVDVRVVDIDHWPHHAEQHRIVSVPTFIAAKKGVEVRRRIGATNAADLRKLLPRT